MFKQKQFLFLLCSWFVGVNNDVWWCFGECSLDLLDDNNNEPVRSLLLVFINGVDSRLDIIKSLVDEWFARLLLKLNFLL